MNRRGFLGSILALGAAPAIVRAESLMRIVIPDFSDVLKYNWYEYGGYEVLNISPSAVISGAEFTISQYAATITIANLDALQNSSTERWIDLLESRMKCGSL